MKKLFLGIVAVVLTCLICVSLSACGLSAKANGIKGEEVTEDQWIATLENLLDNKAIFTVEYSFESSTDFKHKTLVHSTEWKSKAKEKLTYTKNGVLESVVGSQTIFFSGDKIAAEHYTGSKAKVTKIEEYSAIINGKIYNYEKGKDDKWSRKEALSSVVYDAFVYTIFSIIDNFNDFVYSTEHKGYISKNYEDGDDLTVFKFKSGKLTAIYIHQENVDLTDGEHEYKIAKHESATNIIIDYTAKDVIIPAIS